MLELHEAQQKLLALVAPLGSETISIFDAADRILSENIVSPLDLPPFDNSAMDGYAVVSSDVASATAVTPVALRVIGRVAAGERFAGSVQPGTCVRLFTGSPLPTGADAVVMQEDTRPDTANPEMVWITDVVKPWESVRFRGEDVKNGTTVAIPGERLTAARLNLIGAVGTAKVQVSRKPVVGLLATGSELVEPGQPLPEGKIYESNRVGLNALCKRAGATTRIYPLVPDTLEATMQALSRAFEECDAVVTSGGVSVGEFDFVKAAFERLGGSLEFWKVSVKPGKPFVFGRCCGKYLFGLPGNPVSALVTFLLLVRPALQRMQGATQLNATTHPGILAEPFSNRGNRPHYIRVIIDEAGAVRSAGIQASHILRAMADSSGLVCVPPNQTLAAGEKVSVLRWD
jgi:molybdopterin molybdotransferase